jgi:thiamine pyrophosphate-dependent acetolactate synthase large subunit-like protein
MGSTVTHASELEAALERAFAHAGPSLVEVVTEPALL